MPPFRWSVRARGDFLRGVNIVPPFRNGRCAHGVITAHHMKFEFILCVAATWFTPMLSFPLRRGGGFSPQKRDAMVDSFPRPVLVLTVRFCIGVGFECVGRDLLPCQRELQLYSTNIAPPAHIPLFLWS